MIQSKYLKVVIISIDASVYLQHFDDLKTHISGIFDQLKGVIRKEDFVYSLNIFTKGERVRSCQRDEVNHKVWEQWVKRLNEGDISIREGEFDA